MNSGRLFRVVVVMLAVCTAASFTLIASGNGGGEQAGNEASQNSASDLLLTADFPVFEKGRPIEEVQKQLHWRGTLQMATFRNGVPMVVVEYGIAGGLMSDQGKNLWAIFIDNKFERFVDWPGSNPFIPRAADDFSHLFAAANAKPIDVALEEKSRLAEPVPKKSIDYGLTATFLVLGGPIALRTNREQKANVLLRDQFNAQRLRLGMEISEVERVLKVKPLANGRAPGGDVLVYGSEVDFDLIQAIHYSNILLLVKDGRVTGIHSGWKVPGGPQWRESVKKCFTDIKFEDQR